MNIYIYIYIYIVTLHIYTCVIRYVWHISMDIYHVRRSTKVKLWILTSCHWGLRPVNQKGVTLYISVMSIDGNPVLKQPEWQMVQVHHLVAKARPSSLNGFRKRMPVHQRPCQFDMWNCGNPGMPQTNPKKPTSSWVHRVRQKPSPTKSTQHSPSQAFSQKTCLPLQEILPNLPWSKKCHRAIGESPAFFLKIQYNEMMVSWGLACCQSSRKISCGQWTLGITSDQAVQPRHTMIISLYPHGCPQCGNKRRQSFPKGPQW